MTSKSEVPPAAPASPEKKLSPEAAVAAEAKAVKKHEEEHGADHAPAPWYLRGWMLASFTLITSAVLTAQKALDKLESGVKVAESGKLDAGGDSHAKKGH